MGYKIKLVPEADKQLDKLEHKTAKRILKFLHERISALELPRSIGEPLTGQLNKYWKYRVGDYRIICDIQDNIITILVLAIGDRKQVYRR